MLGLMVWLVALDAPVEPSPPPPGTCTIAIEGMPASVMRHHQLLVGAEQTRPLAPRMHVPIGPGGTRLRVLGPRYRGDRRVTPADCASGRPVAFVVQPLPARLFFVCPPDGLTVTCEACPGEGAGRPWLAEDFPAIEMTAFTLEIWLLLRAPGFRRELRRIDVHPGENTLRVVLEPL